MMSAVTLQSFSLFPRLPKDIRLRIYKFTTISRTVTVIWHPSQNGSLPRLSTSEHVPAILQVNQESRSQGLYRQVFEISPQSHYIWVNFELDTIRIPDHALTRIKIEERQQIRWVIVNVEDTEAFFMLDFASLFDMCSLEDLHIIAEDGLGSWGEQFQSLRNGFRKTFGSVDDTRGPRIRITDQSTGQEMDKTNYRELARTIRRRGRGMPF